MSERRDLTSNASRLLRVRVSGAQFRQMADLASASGRTVGSLVNEALVAYLESK